jgi:hypothetical protein
MPPQTPVTANQQVKGAPVKGAPAKGAPTKAAAPAAAGAKEQRQPSEESMWVRYSPHHEFPLSTATSVGVHILIVFLLILVGWVGSYFLIFGGNPPPEVGAVVLDGGGGGNPHGVKDGVRDGFAKEDVQQPTDAVPTTPSADVDVKVDEKPPDLTIPKTDNDSSRVVSGEASSKLSKIAGLAGAWGRGGSGTGGGRGSGEGTGIGAGKGNGRALSDRERQMLRWTMTFRTENGEDYLRQLREIKPGGGAILAIPKGSDGTYEVIRDLNARPAVGQVEDVKKLNRIFWIDDKADSVATLARTLGIERPQYIVAFFPYELEEELKRLEKAAAQAKYGGRRRVEDIQETKFSITADGRPKVDSLTP